MKNIDVYQTDDHGLFLYEAQANELPLDPGKFNIPYGAVLTPPPAAPAGKVARWNGKAWEMVEDYRGASLYMASTGAAYTLGSSVEVDGKYVQYDGWGPLPDWLTDQAPMPPESPDGPQEGEEL